MLHCRLGVDHLLLIFVCHKTPIVMFIKILPLNITLVVLEIPQALHGLRNFLNLTGITFLGFNGQLKTPLFINASRRQGLQWKISCNLFMLSPFVVTAIASKTFSASGVKIQSEQLLNENHIEHGITIQLPHKFDRTTASIANHTRTTLKKVRHFISTSI